MRDILSDIYSRLVDLDERINEYDNKIKALSNRNHGLAPRQSSSGNKQQLLGISKRGNRQLRRLLVQGAHTVLRYCENKTDRVSLWAQKVLEPRGKQKACVALANKMARIAWAVLNKGNVYDSQYLSEKRV
jgi:transposase